MAEVGHAVAVWEERQNAFSQNWNNFANCLIPAADLEGGTEYLLIVSALIMGSNPALNDHYFRLEENNNGQLGDSFARLEPHDANSGVGEMYFYMDRYTTPSSVEDIQFQGHTDSPTRVVRCISFYAVAIKLSDLDAADYEDAENTTNLSSLSNAAWTNGTSITIGDGVSDWLVFGYARCIVDHNGTALHMRIEDDGTPVGEEVRLSGENTVEERQWGGMWALEGIASSTIDLEFQTNSATSGRMDVDRCMLFALRLNAFEDYLVAHDATDTEITSTGVDYGTISVSHTTSTGGSSRDWVAFGMSIISKGGNDGHYRNHLYDSTSPATIIVGDSTDITNGMIQRYAGNADYVPNLRFGGLSAASGTEFTAEIKNQENSDVLPTPDIIDAHIGWFTWELAPLATTVINQLQGPNLGADLYNGTIT